MSLWTPDGEHPVDRPAPEASGLGHLAGLDELSPEEQAEAEALAAEMAEVRRQVASAPASVIVANHVMGFYELAAIHLSQTPPNFPEAAVGIDAMAAVLDKLEGRLGENEPVLRDARAQLQLAYVELKRRADAGE
jgi:hypothetical protein